MAKGYSVLAAVTLNEEALVNIGDLWPIPREAEARVLAMQTKLHQWAATDSGRRFDDVYNLDYDRAFLVVAWHRVRGNKGARTAGVDGIAPQSIGSGIQVLMGRRKRTQVSPICAYTGAGEDNPKSGQQSPFAGYSDNRRPGRASLAEAGAQAHL